MDFRTKTFGTDLRVRPAELQRAMSLYQTVVSQKQKHGQLVFLSGQSGSGRSDTLQALAESFRQSHPRPAVIAGRFIKDQYHPWEIGGTGNFPLAKIAAAIGETISLIPGVAAFIGQILQAGAATWEVVESVAQQSEHSPDVLKRLLRSVAQAQPVICLIDDLDQAEGSGWANLLLDFAAEIHADLPLLFFLTMEGPSELGPHEYDEPNLLFIARYLTARGLAEWWHLHPLSRDDIAAWIGPAAPGLVQHLHGATGGYPGWVIRLWHDWQERGVVAYSDQAACWQWAPNRMPSLNLVKDALDDRLKKLLDDDSPRELEQTRMLLACAALEGRCFTADAVARVMNWNRDELIDFFDDYLVASAEQPDGILQEDTSITIEDPQTGPRTLWRYAFASDLHWYALKSRYVLTAIEQNQMGLALARTLIGLYAPEENQIARTLANLFKVGGDAGTASGYQRTADYATSRAAMCQQALMVMAINKDDWDEGRCRQATTLLMAAGKQMLNTYPFEETLSIFEVAYQIALRSRITADEATALYYCGWLQVDLGNHQAARVQLLKALTICQQIGDRAGEAATWHQLASIDLNEGNYPAAREKFNRSLEIKQQIGDRAGEASTWHQLATIDVNEGNYPAAREKFNRSLEIKQQIGNRAGEASTWHQLASIDVKEGNYPAAREKFNRSLEIKQQIGDCAGEAATGHNLGSIDVNEGNYPAAREKFNRSLEITQQIGDRATEAGTWHQLATIDVNEGNYPAAREKFNRSLEIKQQIGDRAGEAATFYQLGIAAYEQGKLPQAARLIALSFGLLQTIGHNDARIVAKNLEVVAEQLNYTPEQVEALLAEVAQEYAQDRGAGLVRAAFGEP